MLRRVLFSVASAVALWGCAEAAPTPEAKSPATVPTAGAAAQSPSQAAQVATAQSASAADTRAAPQPAAALKAGTSPTIQDLVKFVLGIQGKVGKLSELEKTLGLDFQYDADRASTEIQVKDGTQQARVSLLLEPAPRIVVGPWGESKPDRNFDPRVTMFRIESRADVAPPVSRADKEILAVGSGKREVWAWGRFFYYYPKQDAEWILEWQKDRDDFHYSPADVTKIREVLASVAKVMGKGFSFSNHFAKNHAAAAVQTDIFDFRSAKVSVEDKTMEVHFLNETQIDGFFKVLGIQKITFSFIADRGHRPMPVRVKGCEVTVSEGTWPDEKRTGPDRVGSASTLQVESMSVDCGSE